jgi:RNA polymerase sigma-70 factor (ECF subfamily)
VKAAPQAPYRDVESLIRAAHDDLVRAAYRLLGNRADAQDAVQEGCIKVMRKWATVGTLPTAQQQRAYLRTVVLREGLQILRQPYRRRESLGADQTADPRSTDEAGHAAVQEAGQEAGEHLRLVWKAIAELPEGRQDAMVMFAAGYGYPEIAAALGVDVSTVRSHISNARKQLPRPAPGELEGEPE